MDFLTLLGKRLKDDEVIEVLEAFDMRVLYEFDRLHEGQSDEYWAKSEQDGFEFKFDDSQTLQTIFLYITAQDSFEALSLSECDIQFFESVVDAQACGEAQQLKVTTGTVEFLGVERAWVKIEFATYSIHYEFRSGILALVTLSRSANSLSG